MKVADLLHGKRHAMTVPPTLTIGAVAERLRFAGVGAMIVSHDDETIEGIISERDIAYGLAVHGTSLPALPVSESLAPPPDSEFLPELPVMTLATSLPVPSMSAVPVSARFSTSVPSV